MPGQGNQWRNLIHQFASYALYVTGIFAAALLVIFYCDFGQGGRLFTGQGAEIKMADLKEDGIHITPRKTANNTGKKMIITWTDELHAAIEEVMNLRKKIYSLWLFHTNRGQPYIKQFGTANGFDSIWGRFMDKVLTSTEVRERFTEHDLRAKVASDTEAEHARLLLGYSNIEFTEKVYRRKCNVVKPAS